jgi:hypothetical protein
MKSLPITVVGVGALKPAFAMRDDETVTDSTEFSWAKAELAISSAAAPAVANKADFLIEDELLGALIRVLVFIVFGPPGLSN